MTTEHLPDDGHLPKSVAKHSRWVVVWSPKLVAASDLEGIKIVRKNENKEKRKDREEGTERKQRERRTIEKKAKRKETGEKKRKEKRNDRSGTALKQTKRKKRRKTGTKGGRKTTNQTKAQ